jgi:hypothetical protein
MDDSSVYYQQTMKVVLLLLRLNGINPEPYLF